MHHTLHTLIQPPEHIDIPPHMHDQTTAGQTHVQMLYMNISTHIIHINLHIHVYMHKHIHKYIYKYTDTCVHIYEHEYNKYKTYTI